MISLSLRRFLLSILFLSVVCIEAPAMKDSLSVGNHRVRGKEIIVLNDTLRAARLVFERGGLTLPGGRNLSAEAIRARVSPTGEGDIIRFIQTLPGIATGVEGSSAIYVRGGNLGGNAVTLDGVRLYGCNHLFGFSSAYPMDIIDSSDFHLYGFSSDECNITDSHIRLITKSGDYHKKGFGGNVSNFMSGFHMSTPLIKDRLSLIAAFRVSPAQLGYGLVKNMIHGPLDSLQNLSLSAGDAFIKISGIVSDRDVLSVSFFGSMDQYAFSRDSFSAQDLEWNNMLVNASWSHNGDIWNRHLGLSYNSFSTSRCQHNHLGTTDNTLMLGNGIQEFQLLYDASTSWGRHLVARYGVQHIRSVFSPASTHVISGSTYKSLFIQQTAQDMIPVRRTCIHADLKYFIRDLFSITASGRLDAYTAVYSDIWKDNCAEFSSSLLFHPVSWFSAELAYDNICQFNHTLEGLPLGWSLDLIVPSSSIMRPERVKQYSFNTVFTFGGQYLSMGGYYKEMQSVVFFKSPTAVFSPGLVSWEKNVSIGSGSSRGLEILWEGKEGRFNHRIAYTLSKTDRTFPDINGGQPFPATFDRPHILNADCSCTLLEKEKWKLGFNSFATFQSGNMETISQGSVTAFTIDGKPVTIDVFLLTNNFRMPPYIRWDIGFLGEVHNNKSTHYFNLGVFNVLNRHNPVMITYDSSRRTWMQTSVLPIMPSLSYRVVF